MHGPHAASVARRRAETVAAGRRGDEGTVRRALLDEAPAVRATALAALVRLERCGLEDLAASLGDPSPVVRRRGAEAAWRAGLAADDVARLVEGRLADKDAAVVEAAAFALGELRSHAACPALARVAAGHPDPLCRESAVAALGAIGDPSSLGVILAALTDRPPIRRRAVLALALYEGPEVDTAIEAARSDRDWQVRQAAEDLSGSRGDAHPPSSRTPSRDPEGSEPPP